MRLDPSRLLHKLRATYWFVPSVMVTLAIGLSFVMPWLDQRHSLDPSGTFGWLGQTQTDGARAVLVTVAGSIIGVTGTTFSITMVAVSFASANFGPRLIANFMRDRGNQITLGTFIATFVYCLLVLRRVHNAANESASASYDAFVPHFSVAVALLLALASVGVLIYFIHHVPETINIDRLVAQIGRRLRRDVVDLFPDPEKARGPEPPPGEGLWSARLEGRRRVPLTPRRSGFVQGIDLERLVELCDERSLLVRVQYRPGDFVGEEDALFELWARDERRGPGDGGGGAPTRDDTGGEGSLFEKLRDCVEIGYQRTAHQNCLFLADQLVEVIGRAMSPGINDPFTAIACLDWLKGALVEFAEREERQGLAPEDLPVRIRPIDFERLLATAFDRTRQYVCADRNVALHAMTLLAETAARAGREEHREALRRRMDELRAASAASLADDVGGREVARRHAEAVRLLDDPAARARLRDGAGWFGGSG